MSGGMKNLKAYECMCSAEHLPNARMLYRPMPTRKVPWDKKAFFTKRFL